MNQIQNSVTLIGNIGNDPDRHNSKRGSVARFKLATNETYINAKGEKVTTTHWHRCVVFGKKADIILEFVRKGSKLAIQGKITYDRYKDKDGVERLSVDIVVNDFVMLDAKPVPQAA